MESEQVVLSNVCNHHMYVCVQLTAGSGCSEWVEAQGSLVMGGMVAIIFEMWRFLCIAWL